MDNTSRWRCCLIFILKTFSYEIIKKKLQILYILNVTDIILTLALLKTGLFKEANGAMVNIVESPITSIILKIGLVGALIYYLIKRIAKATEKQLKISNYIINCALGIYYIINLMHLFYICMYLYILII